MARLQGATLLKGTTVGSGRVGGPPEGRQWDPTADHTAFQTGCSLPTLEQLPF